MSHDRFIEKLQDNPDIIAAGIAIKGQAFNVASFEREALNMKELTQNLFEHASKRMLDSSVPQFLIRGKDTSLLGFFDGGVLVALIMRNDGDFTTIDEIVQGVHSEIFTKI